MCSTTLLSTKRRGIFSYFSALSHQYLFLVYRVLYVYCYYSLHVLHLPLTVAVERMPVVCAQLILQSYN